MTTWRDAVITNDLGYYLPWQERAAAGRAWRAWREALRDSLQWKMSLSDLLCWTNDLGYFDYLPVRDRVQASRTCWSWKDALDSLGAYYHDLRDQYLGW